MKVPHLTSPCVWSALLFSSFLYTRRAPFSCNQQDTVSVLPFSLPISTQFCKCAGPHSPATRRTLFLYSPYHFPSLPILVHSEPHSPAISRTLFLYIPCPFPSLHQIFQNKWLAPFMCYATSTTMRRQLQLPVRLLHAQPHEHDSRNCRINSQRMH